MRTSYLSSPGEPLVISLLRAALPLLIVLHVTAMFAFIMHVFSPVESS